MYRLECRVCKATYVVQMGRQFSAPLKEHIIRVCVTHRKREFAFSEHLHADNHIFDPVRDFSLYTDILYDQSNHPLVITVHVDRHTTFIKILKLKKHVHARIS